jgi:glycosyltransferase involved in cell wall biosynthesis
MVGVSHVSIRRGSYDMDGEALARFVTTPSTVTPPLFTPEVAMHVGKLSVIVPAYNEEDSIGQVLQGLLHLEQVLPLPLEIIVVDDASTDRTGSIVADYPTVKYVRHAVNGGKGVALRTGFHASTGDIIVVQDADDEYPPDEIPRLIEPILNDDADVVFGSRFLGHNQGMSTSHRVGNQILSWTTNLLYGVSLTDVMTGYKVFTRKVLDSFTLTEPDFTVEVEIVSKCLHHGWRIVERPIRYTYRTTGESKIGYRDGVKSLWRLLDYQYRLRSLGAT